MCVPGNGAAAIITITNKHHHQTNTQNTKKHHKGVRDSEALRAAVDEVQPDNVALGLRLSQSRPLYEAFRALRDGPGWGALSDAQKVRG